MSTTPGIRPLSDPISHRRAAVEIHAHLRELILNGELPPGMVIAQVEIARQLGVGVIPIREAFRMLQQEGLIDVQPERRAVVAHMEPEEQDALWASRILMESLAVRMGAGKHSDDQLEQMSVELGTMEYAIPGEDRALFTQGHRRFHDLAGTFAGEPINATVRLLAEKTTRYLMLHQRTVPHSLVESLEDHRAIYKTLIDGDADAAEHATGLHVGRAALILLAQVVPSFEPIAVRAALVMTGSVDYLRR